MFANGWNLFNLNLEGVPFSIYIWYTRPVSKRKPLLQMMSEDCIVLSRTSQIRTLGSTAGPRVLNSIRAHRLAVGRQIARACGRLLLWVFTHCQAAV